ncbi:hypothetical protein Syun_025230 [Stephania yunnanensis]|uniref:Uncharacterized protein n=1 Tax=Stephania yunnanensis TaxID=152371 RepID=A0AAP0ER85_9MAGN
MENGPLNTDWEDLTCRICLDFPHNGVFLQRSSYVQGCRPFMCDTDYTHSNCLDRVRKAHNMLDMEKEPTNLHVPSIESTQPTAVDQNERPTCPLCRVFDNFRTFRNRRRPRASKSRHGSRLSNYDASNSDDSVTSVETGNYRVYDIEDEFYSMRHSFRRSSRHLK